MKGLPGLRLWLLLLLFLGLNSSVRAGVRLLHGHVPDAVNRTPSLGRLAATNDVNLSFTLPLRNREALTNLLSDLYNPKSPRYRHFLNAAQFTAQFAPTAQDYAAVQRFAESNGFVVKHAKESRMVLNVRGRAADAERAFHVQLHRYRHPREARDFYAPNSDPVIDSTLPILNVHGLTDFPKLQSMARPSASAGQTGAGSQASGNYLGNDFRHAYAPGVSLTGAGEMVGLFEADGYVSNDIVAYETLAGLTNVPLVNVSIDGFNGSAGSGNLEVALDIEMAIAMAPGLSAVVVFEVTNSVPQWIDALDSMASSNQIRQFSSSWGYESGSDPNSDFDTVFQRMAAQGQSFFQASGDGEAWVNPIWVPADSIYVTSVGGTSLTMTGAGAGYASETTWNSGNLGPSQIWSPNGNGNWGSGGGVSSVYDIPDWQTGMDMSSNGGSTNSRNIPDVAMVANNVWAIYHNGATQVSGALMGTSIAAPLWAGFTALINQQAAALANPPVGFLNPSVYALGQGGDYASTFHDIVTGNNTWSNSISNYYAVSGYDLCTGWGTPNGSGLIDVLAVVDTLAVFPASGFNATGGPGGPFTSNSQTLLLTNAGGSAVSWVFATDAPWLSASSSNGTLAAHAVTNVVVALNSVASNEPVGSYSADVFFTNLTSGIAQDRAFSLAVLQPVTFTSGPQDQLALPGRTVFFNATAIGTDPIGYQWQLNGTNLADNAQYTGTSTANLTLANLNTNHAGTYSLIASNGVNTNSISAKLVVLPSHELVRNGGFETGDFASWALTGNTSGNNVVGGADFVHSGQYGVQLGSGYTLGYLSETLHTVPGQQYAVSMWLNNPSGEPPNEFNVTWGTNLLCDFINLPQASTNLHFWVTATGTNTVLQLGFRDDPDYLGLDDVSVLPLQPTLLQLVNTGGQLQFSWIAINGANYQLQTTSDLTQTNWSAYGSPMTATNSILTVGNLPTTNGQQYFRIVVVQ